MEEPAELQGRPDGDSGGEAIPRTPMAGAGGKRLKGLAFTALKIAIAVVAIWWVLRAVSWYDTGELAAGTEIKAVKFLETVPVRVLGQTLTDGGAAGKGTPGAGGAVLAREALVRVEFPQRPVRVEVDGREQKLVIDENTPVAGGGVLGLSREKEIPLFMLSEVKGQRVQQGLRTLLVQASAKWPLLAGAWLLLGVPFVITAIRWRNLMRPQGIDMPLGKCLQLTFVGQFYSIILPGITGGDLVKIVYAARLTGSKTKSFITIVLDRVIGLVALMVIAGTAAGVELLMNSGHAAAPLQGAGGDSRSTLLNVFLLIVTLLGVMMAGSVVYFSRRLRRLLGITWFIENFGSLSRPDAVIERAEHARLEHLFRVLNGVALAVGVLGAGALAGLRWGTASAWAQHNLVGVVVGICVFGLLGVAALGALALHRKLVNRATPLMGKAVKLILGVDETLHVYRGHLGLLAWAFVISVVSQLTLPLSAWLSGMAFGMNAPVTHYMAYVPVAILAASLPISPPAGIGVFEGLLLQFFREPRHLRRPARRLRWRRACGFCRSCGTCAGRIGW